MRRRGGDQGDAQGALPMSLGSPAGPPLSEGTGKNVPAKCLCVKEALLWEGAISSTSNFLSRCGGLCAQPLCSPWAWPCPQGDLSRPLWVVVPCAGCCGTRCWEALGDLRMD